MKTAIIAEKPSVAREIASIVGATDKKDGYIQGNNYLVTWAFGHLVGLAMPEEYGAIGFNKAHLPILPQEFVLKSRQVKAEKGYKADTGALKQLKIIGEVFNQCDKIIVATDAGREGELIFRYIYNFLGCKKPFERLWISSLTEKAIRQGLDNLKNGADYDHLYYAAKTRSEADWLVGINATQALSIAAGRGTYSLGRVQTPTLAMVCSRYLENKNFVSTPYWQLKTDVVKDNISFSILSKDKIENKQKVNKLFQTIQNESYINVQSVECKKVNQEPPLLYDLTTLQKEANIKHGFSADKTLSIAQKLYELKFTTYPRTGSRYLSHDVFETIPQLLATLHTHEQFGVYSQSLLNLNNRSIDDKKVTDHHAILITEIEAKGLSTDEQLIYNMIAGRMLESFSDKCIKDSTTVTLICADIEFIAKGSVMVQAGWRAVYNSQEEGDDSSTLPNIMEGDILPLTNTELLEKQTKPKFLHTEASLLSTMETAGKDLEDEAQRLAMKISGLGTPATRASIIETLFARDYIRREKKLLVPTYKGLAVYEVVKDKQIADVELTGMWEDAFMKIEKGEREANNFKKSIEVYASKITEELLATTIVSNELQTFICPKCKSESILVYPKVAKCINTECGLVIFRSICGKTLSDTQISDLLSKGKTGIIKGLKSKAGKSFDASLELDTDFKIKFVFPPKKTKK